MKYVVRFASKDDRENLLFKVADWFTSEDGQESPHFEKFRFSHNYGFNISFENTIMKLQTLRPI